MHSIAELSAIKRKNLTTHILVNIAFELYPSYLHTTSIHFASLYILTIHMTGE